MTTATLAIPLAFVLLAGLMCWHIATVKGKWWVKLAFIVAVPSFGLVVWNAISSYQGWPAEEKLPNKALLLWVDIIEPDANSGEEGAIHVWVLEVGQATSKGPLLGHGRPKGIPRAYGMTYNRKLHEMLDAAKGRLMSGQSVVLERATENSSPATGKTGNKFSIQEGDLKVYDLPPPTMPKKNTQ